MIMVSMVFSFLCFRLLPSCVTGIVYIDLSVTSIEAKRAIMKRNEKVFRVKTYERKGNKVNGFRN